MKRRISAFLSLFLLALAVMAEGKAKYVFYFIGDGMGVNQVNAAETYLGALDGRIGITPLCFPSFPFSAFVNTQSATNGVTDSAAAGTALATGNKTKNGALGVLKDLTTPVNSIAQWAHDAGAAVGITTSVTVDHATPAAFYAHVGKRGDTYMIGQQLVATDFDFFAGSDFTTPQNPDGGADLYQQARDKGYCITRSYKEYQKRSKKADKMILLQSEEASKVDRGGIPYALDRQEGDLTLPDITRAAINFLTKKQGGKDGFFLMVEGGKIDWLCHANDVAFIPELIEMDDAVKVAYEFYQQHPDETLIVITADHETGGIVLGRGAYELHTDLLKFQKMSAEEYTRYLDRLHKKLGNKLTWKRMQRDLKENWGFWGGVKLSDHQTDRMKRAFEAYINGKSANSKNLYSTLSGISDAARRTLAECALIGWQSGGHSNGYVPVFAIGVGSEAFAGKIDNTQIPYRIAKAAGWKVPEGEDK